MLKFIYILKINDGGLKMKSLISFDGFSDVANNLIDKISNAVGWVVSHDTPKKIAVDTYIKDIQESNFDAITKASLISRAKKTIKEYCNQRDIVLVSQVNKYRFGNGFAIQT